MRVLVTGSNGLLGSKLVDLLAGDPAVQPLGVSRAANANAELARFDFLQADLAEPGVAHHVIGSVQPDLILHTAAMTDVDGCEREPAAAWRLNVDMTRAVVEAASAVNARVVHLSTEYVFDGSAGPYSEVDATNPQSVYGASKLASERPVLEAGGCVARTTVVFGHVRHARPDFVTGLVARLRGGESMRIVTDQIGSPTLADNLAKMVWRLGADHSARGIFNTVGGSVIDRYAFALQIADVFELDARLLQPIVTSDLAQAAPRPLRAGLRMDTFKARYPEIAVLSSDAALRELRRQMGERTAAARVGGALGGAA